MTKRERDEDLQLYVAEPCSVSWDEMTGDDERRWCAKCALHVIHGTSLTRLEALRLVQNATDRVCMQLELDATGAPRFRPESPTRAPRWMAPASAAILAACGRTGAVEPPVDPPAVVEAASASDPLVVHEPTVLDPLPEPVSRRSPVPPPCEAEAITPDLEQPPVHVTVRQMRTSGAVAVRRVDPQAKRPK